MAGRTQLRLSFSLGAGPGLLTDPSSKYPLGRTPADLASLNGYKGISGFLAETSLTRHLSTLTVNADGTPAVSEGNAYQTHLEHVAPRTEENVPDKLSLDDSLTAVCNATQAAARIHQIFRLQSFQRRQLSELDSCEALNEDEQAISLLAGKASRFGNSYGKANAAAIQIQKKFRGWKKRKEFLLIRQKVVRIQAHVRGHQARRKHKPIIWSVGILEKVILRWRRKRNGLRGYRQPQAESNMDCTVKPEDDYDLLKQGRKQTEERMQKALDRVKSMVRYPEARAQYRRLLSATEGILDTKDTSDAISPDALGDMRYEEDEHLMEVAGMLDDETFISLIFP